MSLIYRGTSSDDVHFNVTERRVYNAPAFDVTGIEVPGRSGDILNSQERFKNKAIVYTGFIRSSDFPGDTTWERLSRGLRTIKAWICGDAGKYHDLTDDYDPGFVRRAFVSGETAISEVLDRPDGATITITFMAEPFMYEESDPIELPETGTASGAIASFEGVAAPLQSLKFSIEPKQSGSGDPSPSNIRPISGWSQVDGVAAGGNLFDDRNLTRGLPATAIGSNINTITSTTRYAYWGFPSHQTQLIKSSASSDINAFNALLFFGYKDGKLIEYNGNYSLNGTKAIDGSRYDYIRICAGAPSGVEVPTSLDGHGYVKVEPGSTATPYTPYQGTPITVDLGQTVYGGTVDAIAGKLVIDRVGVAITNANEIGANHYAPIWRINYNAAASTAKAPASTSVTNIMCNAFKAVGEVNRGQPGTCFISGSSKWIQFDFSDTGIADANAAKTYFLSLNPFIVYELATPIEVDLTPVSVSSLLGQNNIWANTGDTEVVYVEPTENPTEWPSKPRLEITMAGAGTLTVNGKTWSIGAYTGTLICDSEIMDWYDSSNLKNSLVSGDGFPEFQPGENVITYTGGITKVVAKPRWRTL